MSKFQSVRASLRDALAKVAEDHGLFMDDTSFSNRTHILLFDKEGAGSAHHPVRVEIDIWKPLNQDHSVAEE